MQYLSLKKAFHIDERKCNDLYGQRFNSESCHKLGFKLENGYECFYLINNEVLSLITEILQINSYLEKSINSREFPNGAEYYLKLDALVEEIKNSNQLEGIYNTRQELLEMINATPKEYRKFYGMVNKYQKIIQQGFEPIESVGDIRKEYDEILLMDITNEDDNDRPDGVIFRKNSVEITSGTKVIHKGLNGEGKIIDMLERGLKILNDNNMNLLIRVAIFHYLFEYTHPFYNGNGRMGRYLASLYLSSELNILCALQLSIACTHHSRKYYESFEVTNDVRNKGDLTVFIINFLEIYLSGLDELKEHFDITLNKYNRAKTIIYKKKKEVLEKKRHEIYLNSF